MKTILLVDDSPEDVSVIKEAFQRAALPYALFIVHDGEEAMDYLSGKVPYADRARYPMPALIFLVMMPRCNGYELLHWIRATVGCHTIPTVMFTGSDRPIDIDSSYLIGANSYLVKPVGLRELEKLLTSVTGYWLETNTTVAPPGIRTG
jgi:CheY-like chemotaxis protein